MKKIIFTGGGTGGHIMPNIALMNELQNRYQIEYIGEHNGMEEKIIKNENYIFYGITACKLRRSFSLKNLLLPFKLAKGFFEAKKILKIEKPNLIFCKGGYVSVPVVLASKILKIPIVCHESDYSIGLANKISSKFAKIVCTSFDETARTLKNGIFTGSPIRKTIFYGNAENVKKKYYFNQTLPTLLVIGGSLGSQNINSIIESNANELSKKFNLIHITGKNTTDSKIANYHKIQFTSNIQDFYNASDLVITRGGSNVLFELLALKLPMLIIPLKKGSRGDQVQNAKYFVKNGFAKMCDEDEISKNSNILIENLEFLLKN